ncbi:MAG TPA: hypothetical protein VLE73_00095 [Candidatus Saccharimonadales bacterium]|nr:hypothetical protein [Candidatus Saccharimonadales bacterium]
MYTYALMCVPFVATVLVLDLLVLRTRVTLRRRTWAVIGALLVLTLIFDQFMERYVYVPNPAKSLLLIGAMPIEDISYTIVAVIGMGMLVTYGKKDT